MKNLIMTHTLAVSAIMSFSLNAFAAFVEVDTFESYTLGNSAIGGPAGWLGDSVTNLNAAADPTGGGNQVGRLSGDADEVLNTAGAVSEGNVGTFFFRAYLVASETNTDVTIGFTNLTGVGGSPNNSNYASLVRFNVDDGNSGANNAFEVYDGSYQSVTSPADVAPIETGEWYSFWMVSDTSANTWELYMQGGDVATQQQVAIGALDTDFAFRGGDVAVNSIMFRPNTDNNGEFMYIDDIYVDSDSGTGGNLSNPVIPEPSTFALMVLAGAGALMGARRKR